ncbi:MAG: helix-turn-helix transcriptional regulator [Rhodothermales bacterium]|nr:helix-turn-helix transcriptional regulator [Rhodothermales bacterium]
MALPTRIDDSPEVIRAQAARLHLDFSAGLRQHIRGKGISHEEVAEAIGKARSTVTDSLNGKNDSCRTLLEIAAAAQLDLCSVLAQPSSFSPHEEALLAFLLQQRRAHGKSDDEWRRAVGIDLLRFERIESAKSEFYSASELLHGLQWLKVGNLSELPSG